MLALSWPQHATARSTNLLPSYASKAPANQAANEPGSRGLNPVNPKQAHINLLRIEERLQVFSHTVLSPNRRHMAFTEAVYLRPMAQVFARLYLAPLAAPPRLADTHQLPEDYYVSQARQAIIAKRLAKADKKSRTTCKFLVWCKTAPKPPPQPHSSLSPANPNAQAVLMAQPKRSERQGFEMIIPIDWSEDSQVLLAKQTKGKLYQGITRSEPITINARTRRPVYYPELAQAVKYYWGNQTISPTLNEMNWLIEPIGWAPGSSTKILNEVWAYMPNKRLFLGLWTLDIANRSVVRTSMQYNPGVAVASNGATVSAQ